MVISNVKLSFSELKGDLYRKKKHVVYLDCYILELYLDNNYRQKETEVSNWRIK